MESGGRAAGRHVAGNIRVIREHKGISQAVIAEEMRAREWDWHQTTVGRVENGTQALRVGEAVDLAGILGVTVARLLMPGEEAAEIAITERAADTLISAWKDTADAARRLDSAIRGARRHLGGAGKSKYERVRKTADLLASQVEACTLESALEKSRSPYRDHGDC